MHAIKIFPKMGTKVIFWWCLGTFWVASSLSFRCSDVHCRVRLLRLFASESPSQNSSAPIIPSSSSTLKRPFVSSKDDLFSTSYFKRPSFESMNDFYDDSDDQADEKELPDVVERNKKTSYVGRNPVNRGLFGEDLDRKAESSSSDVFDVIEEVDEFRFTFNMSSFEQALQRKASLQAQSISADEDTKTQNSDDSNVLLNSALLERVNSDAEVIDSPEGTIYRLEVDSDDLREFFDDVDNMDDSLEFSLSDATKIDASSGDSIELSYASTDSGLIEGYDESDGVDNAVYLTELEKKLSESLRAAEPMPPTSVSWRMFRNIKFQSHPGDAALDLLSMVYFGAFSITASILVDVAVSQSLRLRQKLLLVPIIRSIVSDSLIGGVLLTAGLFWCVYLSFRSDLKEQFAVSLVQYLWALPIVRVIRFLSCFFIKHAH